MQVFVVTTSSLSAATALAFALLSIFKTYATVAKLFFWDVILAILWLAVISIFAPMYANENPEMDAGIQRMKNALIVDYICFALWVVGATVGGWVWWRARGDRRLFAKEVR